MLSLLKEHITLTLPLLIPCGSKELKKLKFTVISNRWFEHLDVNGVYGKEIRWHFFVALYF